MACSCTRKKVISRGSVLCDGAPEVPEAPQARGGDRIRPEWRLSSDPAVKVFQKKSQDVDMKDRFETTACSVDEWNEGIPQFLPLRIRPEAAALVPQKKIEIPQEPDFALLGFEECRIENRYCGP
jgi:hypothetical protein